MAHRIPSMPQVQHHAPVQRKNNFSAALDSWNQLSSAFDQMYRRSQSQYSFQHLYNIAYQLVQHNQGDFIYEKLQETMSDRILDQRGKITLASDENILAVILEQWNIHQVTTARTADVLMTLERMYCTQHKRPVISVLGQRLFGSMILCTEPVSSKVQIAFLNAIEKDRNDEVAPPLMLLRGVSQMCIDIDRRDVFEQLLQLPLLESTRAFYHREANELLPNLSTPAFVTQYFKRLREERHRMSAGVDESTVPKVEAILASEFLGSNIETLLHKPGSGVHDLLFAYRHADLAELYLALHSFGDTVPIVQLAAKFFLEEGLSTLSEHETASNPILFVEKLIELSDRVSKVLKESMSPNHKIDRFAESQFDKALEEVVNRHQLAAEFISRYVDAKLRAHVDDSEIEMICEKVMHIFVKLRDKDLFENAYRQHLARRLLAGGGNKNIGQELDQEHIFIRCLKRECGAAIASSLEGMFADRRLSEDLLDTFTERMEIKGEKLPLEFSAMVLTSGFWPPCVKIPLELPWEMSNTASIFEQFYLGRYKGRRLEWLHHQSTADISLRFGPQSRQRRVDVSLPTLCLVVAFLFQDSDEPLYIADIAAKIGVVVPEAARAVASLSRTNASHNGILCVSNNSGPLGSSSNSTVARAAQSSGSSNSTSFNAQTLVTFNENFSSKHAKIRILQAQVKERLPSNLMAPASASAEVDPDDRRQEEDRKFKIDAAIVRIMKSRKSLEHKELVSEVLTVLKKSFVPKIDDVKRRVEHLIEREFLERSSSNNAVYNYLA